MIKVTYIEHNGTQRVVDAEEGMSLMEAAVSNLVPGIDGDCGGVCACATCHVFVDDAWIAKLAPMESMEDAMLNLAEGRDANSRLACQLKAAPELDGLVLRTPIGQH
ncbi:MAG: 2Fe-2S iron-sulfur cluster binding domain-containing protein [Chloroflexota bacterium]|nr:MAG: 2Fe-2S iron-sulfur cluster binding domain-containing protein [Chloroflexota bacterium]